MKARHACGRSLLIISYLVNNFLERQAFLDKNISKKLSALSYLTLVAIKNCETYENLAQKFFYKKFLIKPKTVINCLVGHSLTLKVCISEKVKFNMYISLNIDQL